MTSGIEWTDETWNPMTGCTKVSSGCAHCYAEAIAPRTFKGRPFTDVRFHPERLFKPLSWRKPRRCFVNSMSDLFHEDLTDAQITRVIDIIEQAPCHTFQVLTKRAERMCEFFQQWRDAEGLTAPPNLWLGVSVENQRMANKRLPLLLQTPAAVRFISAEPLLGPLDISPWLYSGYVENPHDDHLDWVIVGGESGPGARPCSLEHVRRIVNDCRGASVPVFVKQLGRHPVADDTLPPPGPRQDHLTICEMRDPKGGNPDEWPEDLRLRLFPS